MSYSFSVKAADKTAAKTAVVAEFDKVVASQPIHVKDRAAAQAAAFAFIDMLRDTDGDSDILVSCYGSISERTVDNAGTISVNASASAQWVQRVKAN